MEIISPRFSSRTAHGKIASWTLQGSTRILAFGACCFGVPARRRARRASRVVDVRCRRLLSCIRNRLRVRDHGQKP